MCSGEETNLTQCKFFFDPETDVLCDMLKFYERVQTITCGKNILNCFFANSLEV